MPNTLSIILNYNDYDDHTRKCLLSLERQRDVHHDILVIDNNSREDPTAKIKKSFPRVTCIRNRGNYGVAGGRNIGLKLVNPEKYKYTLIFDNDAVADPLMLKELLAAIEKDPSIGICGPKILQSEKKNAIYRAGCTHWKLTYLHSFTEIARTLFAALNRPMPDALDTIRGLDKVDRGQFDAERDVDFQLGAAMLIRTSVFSDIGMFDEDFNPYGSEDIDFCVRIKKARYTIRYIPQAICWHPRKKGNPDDYTRTYQNTKNIILLARKNLPAPYFWAVFSTDFLFITIPLMLTQCVINQWRHRRRAIYDALKWNLNDIRARGLLL